MVISNDEKRLSDYSKTKEMNIKACEQLEMCLNAINVNALSVNKERISDLNDKKKKIKEDNIKISVVAEFSSGKSTFLNSLIFKETVLESSIGETTATLYEIKCSPDNQCHIEMNGKKTDCDYENMKTLIKEKNKEFKEGSDWAQINVEIPHEMLRKGVILYDTPGFGSLNDEKMTPIIKSSLSMSDAVLLILNVDQGFKKSESEKVKNIMSAFNPESWYVILNKIDGYMDEANYGDIVNDLKEQTRRNILEVLDNKQGEIKVYTLSAKYGIGDEKKELKDMFDNFKDEFWENVIHNKEKFLKNRFDELENFKKGIINDIENTNVKMKVQLKDLENIKAAIVGQVENIGKIKDSCFGEFSNQINMINIFLKNKIKRKNDLKHKISQIIFNAAEEEIDKLSFLGSIFSQDEFKNNIIKAIESKEESINEILKEYIGDGFMGLVSFSETYNKSIENLNRLMSEFKNSGWKDSDLFAASYDEKSNEFDIKSIPYDKIRSTSGFSNSPSVDLFLGTISALKAPAMLEGMLATIGSLIGADLIAILGESAVPVIGWAIAAGTIILTIVTIKDKIEKNKQELKVKFEALSSQISSNVVGMLDDKILIKLEDGFTEVLFRIKSEIKLLEQKFTLFLNSIESPEKKEVEINILNNDIKKTSEYLECIRKVSIVNYNLKLFL